LATHVRPGSARVAASVGAIAPFGFSLLTTLALIVSVGAIPVFHFAWIAVLG
jgi:hypothetical protein